jgi:hypothetical protein
MFVAFALTLLLYFFWLCPAPVPRPCVVDIATDGAGRESRHRRRP